MIKNLFSSKVIFEILEVMFQEGDKYFSTSEIIEKTKRRQVNILRSLDKLIKWEFILKKKKGNQNFFKLNKENIFYEKLSELFAVYENNKSKYVLMTEEGGASLLSMHYFFKGYSSELVIKSGILSKIPKMINHFKGNYFWAYFDKKDLEDCTKESFEKLLGNTNFLEKTVYRKSIRAGQKADKLVKKLEKNNFKVTKKEAVKLLNDFCKIIESQISYNFIAVFDLRDQPYSNYLKDYFNKKIKGTDYSINYLMEKLLNPLELTKTQLMRKDLIELSLNFKNRKSTENKINKELKGVHEKWKWINYGYRGPELEIDYFQSIFNEFNEKNKEQLKKELVALENFGKKSQREKKKIFQELKIDKKHQNFINALSLLSYLKIYRKDIAFMLIYSTYKILERFNNKFSQDNLFYLTLEEAQDLINNKCKITKKELREREKECVFVAGDEKIITGEEAITFIEKNAEKDSLENEKSDELKLLEGTTASLGETGDWVFGEVKIINSEEDMVNMNEGDILVSVATTPEVLPAMKKAAAIVTDHGGITCHAAIVSRELNKPCLIGTKYATKVFKNGDKVVVCPRHGYIKFV